MVTAPAIVTRPSKVTVTSRTALDRIITRRGESRSTYTPPNSMSAARGMAIIASTVPSARALPVRTSAS